MQIQPVFSERFTVVGKVDHRRVVFSILLRQEGNRLRQHMIRIEQSIVVGIDDRLLGTLGQICRIARRLVLSESGWIAFEIGGAMVAELMQHEHQTALAVSQHLIEPVQ